MKKEKSNKNLIIAIGAVIVIVCAVLTVLFLNKKQDIYKFDFNDGYIPGKTFNGEINLTNGEVNFKIIYGCSLRDPEECPDDEIVKGTLNKTQLELVKDVLEKSNRKDNHYLLTGVSYLIKGDKICDEETNETCDEIGRQLIKYSNQN